MAKAVESTGQSLVRVILTGPECTGKTMLTMELAKQFGTLYISEYAREYIESLSRPYTYYDVLHIAQKQVELMETYSQKADGLLFVDTYLIITKVWFKRVFEVIPDWIEQEIYKTKNDLYLLCKPDIPWEPDPVRENGGEMREILFNEYIHELVDEGLNYAYVEGKGNERINTAVNEVQKFLSMVNR
jgi:nicotinamide riboside kinase